MANQYPSAPNTFSNPAGTNTLPGTEASGLPHATQHADLNDAVESHEAVLGTNAGTSVLKHFAAGQFPVRATGVAAIGTLQQTLVGGSVSGLTGTINSPVIGTPAISDGTSTAMKIVGTDILSSAGLFGTTGFGTAEVFTVGTFTNSGTSFANNVGSLSFTPQVQIKPLILFQVNWRNSAAVAVNNITLNLNGTTIGSSVGNSIFVRNDWVSAAQLETNTGFIVGPTMGAGTAGTLVALISTSAGSAVVFGARLSVLPFPAT